MESIGKVIANLGTEKPTANQAMTKYSGQDEPTLEEKREDIRRQLGVSSLANTFDNYQPVKGTEKALAACRHLAEGKAEWLMLLLYGGVGNGKTHLLEALVMGLHKRGIFCRVLNYGDMMRNLRNSIKSDMAPSFDQIFNAWCRVKYLVIDDVGIGGSDTEWSMKMLDEVILARYRDELFTVLSTNMDLEELPDRVISRFNDPLKARMIENAGEDYRPKKGA